MSSTFPRTCVTPQGFRFAIHKPSYTVSNLRQRDFVQPLGELSGETVDNSRNFPDGEVVVEQADWIYEIPNPLPFRGATYITKSWGDAVAEKPTAITLPEPPLASMSAYLKKWGREGTSPDNTVALFKHLPPPVLLALAANSTDSLDLTILAKLCGEFTFDRDGRPTGMCYREDGGGRRQAKILRPDLFEILVNNEYLPDGYKDVMVLRPGAQGDSEIVGDRNGDTHIFEYLRRNSYIAGGHYAANMANDTIRYHIRALRPADMDGLRHIYYQRTYVQLAAFWVCGCRRPASP